MAHRGLHDLQQRRGPQAHEQHRKYLESLPATSYPLKSTGSEFEVNETQRVTEGAFEQR